MIAYFDTSALLKLLLAEEASDSAVRIWHEAERLVSSRLTYPEGRAGLAVARRVGRLSPRSFEAAKQSLETHFAQVDAVEPTEHLCRLAGELADRHDLRGYDAVHLASALAFGRDGVVLASWDVPLKRASLAEGIAAAV